MPGKLISGVVGAPVPKSSYICGDKATTYPQGPTGGQPGQAGPGSQVHASWGRRQGQIVQKVGQEPAIRHQVPENDPPVIAPDQIHPLIPLEQQANVAA